MTSYTARLLCLGDEQALLHSRRAVLRFAGYDAQTARLSEVELLLRIGKKSELLIVSAGSSELPVGAFFLLLARRPPSYWGAKLSVELLAQVERQLVPADQPMWVR